LSVTGSGAEALLRQKGWWFIMNFAESNDDRTAAEQDESVVASEETIDLTAPTRHFHRTVKSRTLSSGPLANPRRTRLI
jgi:hypothetical protein